MDAVLERTTRKDQKIAQSSISQIEKTSRKVIRKDSSSVKIKIQENGEFLEIPKKALYLLFDILKNMAEGKSITLLPSDAQVSTQQAADLLNVSRPHLIKLLEKGEMPFKKVGAHRRVELKDVIAYEEKKKKNRKDQLDFLSRQAQELNMGY
jgi:excisionase family DNA binding protein